MSGKTPIQRLYEKIPSFSCKEGCTDCCDNWIQFAPEEEERCGGFDCKERGCPKLDRKTGCTVYENRPFICRLFASCTPLPCPHGYGPEHPLTKEETDALLKEYLRLRKEQLHGSKSDQ